jgi:hypothetical protein
MAAWGQTRPPPPLSGTRGGRRVRRGKRTALSEPPHVPLTALSLSHLAHGVDIVTGSSTYEAWAMAVGIDLGFVALELSQLSIGDRLRRHVSRYARPAIVGTLVGSAAMNAFAFAAQADGYCMQAAAVAMGVAIPALIFAMTKVGAALYIDCHSRG